MRKRILLPLFFFVSLCGCASENVSAIDHDLAERKLKNYDQFVNDEKFKAPEMKKISTLDFDGKETILNDEESIILSQKRQFNTNHD